MSWSRKLKTTATKGPKLDIQTTTIKELMRLLEEIIVITRIIAFGRIIFICRKQRKNETSEQLHANFVELASRADIGDRED